MTVTRTFAALVLILVGSNGAHAQWGYGPPAAVYVNPGPYYAAPPVVVAPGPGYAAPPVVVAPSPGYSYVPGPYPGSVVVDYRTGRWCTFQPSGYRWCWTP